MNKKCLLFLFLILTFKSFGQVLKKDLDSINNLILKLKAQPKSFARDTSIVNQLNEKMDEEISLMGTEKGLETVEEAIKLSEEINWRKGIANSMFRKVEAIQVKSQYFSAIKESLKIINKFKKEEFPRIYMNCIHQIAGCYMWMERPYDALKYYNLLFKENVPNRLTTSAYNDSFTEFGALYTRYLNNPKKGMEYFSLAKKAYEAKKDTFGLAYLNSYMAFAYEKLGKRKLAENSFDFAIKYYKKIGVDYLLPDALNYASEYYYRKGDLKKSEGLALEAFILADKLKILFSQRDANKNLYFVKKATRNYESALKHYELFADSRDSMSEANIDDRLKVVTYEYDTQLQKAEIDKKTRENERKNSLIIALVAGILALVIISFLVYRFLNIRKNLAENEVLQLQQEKQIIGSKSILKGQEEERSRLAKDLHDGLGGLLSGIKFTLNSMTGNQVLSEQSSLTFHRAIGQLDNAISELRRVAHSMMPEALLKFGLKDALQDYCEGINQSSELEVNFEAWGLEGRQEQSMEVSLYRIVQELLNNTMKHANATKAHVQLVQNENLLTLTVEDNGKGFDVNNLQTNKGAGISNVESRVAYLKGKMDIKSDPSHGTSIEVQVMI